MSLISDIKELLDETGTATFWTAQHIADAANRAQMDVWARVRHDLVSVVLSVDINDDIVLIPSTILIPLYITLNNKKYFPTTHAKLEQEDRKWRAAAQGYPKWFVVWDAGHFRVWPRPNSLYEFELIGVQYPPTELTDAVLDITAPTLLKQSITHLAAAELVEFSRPQLADAWRAESIALELNFKKLLRNRDTHRITRLRPASRVGHAGAGVISIGKNYS